MTSIGSHAYSSCTGLISVTISNSVRSIGEYAFSDCSSMTSITIPNSVITIGKYAFASCKGLTSVTISEGVTTIGGFAFEGCSNLTSVFINMKNIRPIIFKGLSGLTSVTIGNAVTSIGEEAFYGCKGLTSVTIGNAVTNIGSSAFEKCSALTSITIGNSVTSIGNSAFKGCSGLTSVTIPNKVMSIGDEVFYGCSKIKEIYSWNSTPPSTSNNTFSGMNTIHAKVFVPEGSADAYKYALGWMDFLNIYETEFSPILSEASPIIISDNAPEITNGSYQEKTITYVRESAAISKDNYASFCLPFAIDPNDTQFKAVYVPVGLALYNADMNTLRLGFYKSDDIIPAGTPFFALLAVDNKVEIKNALPLNYDSTAPSVKTSVVRTFNFSDVSGIMNENNDYAINFSGTYKRISPANAYTFNTDGSIGASASVVPFRAYVVLTKNNTNAKIITSFDENAETTGIKEFKITNEKSSVHDLNGRMVNENNLKAGIYIKNGKKYIK